MTTSGVYSFNPTTDSLITMAYQMAEIYMPGDTLDNSDMVFAMTLLNSMLKDWEKKGIRCWKRRQAILFTQLNQNNYGLGATSTDHVTNSFVNTTTTATLAATTVIMPVVSTVGMNVSDQIGVQLDNGSRQWSTIITINSGTSVTIATGLISTSSIGNTILTYTTGINRPLQVLRGTVFDLTNGSEQVINDMSYDEYFDMPLKTTPSRPNQFYYDKLLDNGVLYLYPTPNIVNQIIKFTYADSFLTQVNASDTFDFPEEWYHTILYNLTVELMYSKKMFLEVQVYEPKAKELLASAVQWDADLSSLKITRNRNSRTGR